MPCCSHHVLCFQMIACFILPFVLSVAHMRTDRNGVSPHSNTLRDICYSVSTHMYTKMAFYSKENCLLLLEWWGKEPTIPFNLFSSVFHEVLAPPLTIKAYKIWIVSCSPGKQSAPKVSLSYWISEGLTWSVWGTCRARPLFVHGKHGVCIIKLFQGFIFPWLSFLQPETHWNHFRSGRQEFTKRSMPQTESLIPDKISTLSALEFSSSTASLYVIPFSSSSLILSSVGAHGGWGG